jgi:hypothetical protein
MAIDMASRFRGYPGELKKDTVLCNKKAALLTYLPVQRSIELVWTATTSRHKETEHAYTTGVVVVHGADTRGEPAA